MFRKLPGLIRTNFFGANARSINSWTLSGSEPVFTRGANKNYSLPSSEVLESELIKLSEADKRLFGELLSLACNPNKPISEALKKTLDSIPLIHPHGVFDNTVANVIKVVAARIDSENHENEAQSKLGFRNRF